MTVRSNAPIIYTVVPSGANYAMHRDGIAMKTPAGKELVLPTLALVESITEEWRVQGEKIVPASMPMMQLAATAIDIIGKDRTSTIEQTSAYGAVDLLCVWADAPEDLVIRQHKAWQPILDWCAERLGAKLRVGQGIKAAEQSPETLQALRHAVENFDNFALTGLKHAAELSGSLVLGLALAEKHLTAEEVFHAAELEGLYQIEKWGDDPASAKRHESIKNDLASCEKWFRLLNSSR